MSAPIQAITFGLAIVGAAFVLAWAAEVAQLDISAGLAIAVLALIAVLPEYAVDLVFAWRGGEAYETYGAACGPAGVDYNDTPCSFALANMTGANRLLIGVGWSMVVLLAWWRYRTLSRRRANRPSGSPPPSYVRWRARPVPGSPSTGGTPSRWFSQQPPSTR